MVAGHQGRRALKWVLATAASHTAVTQAAVMQAAVMQAAVMQAAVTQAAVTQAAVTQAPLASRRPAAPMLQGQVAIRAQALEA